MLISKHVGCTVRICRRGRAEDCAQCEEKEAIMAGNRYSTKKPQNSVLLAKKRMLALASQERVEQIQGGKPMQTKMIKDDRQGPHVKGRNLNECNTIMIMRSKRKGREKQFPICQKG